MAKKEEIKENTEKKQPTKNDEKKVTTGNTKKVVQKRNSSTAGKGATKKENNAKTSNKTNAKRKATNKAKTENSSPKANDTSEKEVKKEDIKQDDKKNTEKSNEKNNKNKVKAQNVKTTKKEKKEVKVAKKVEEKEVNHTDKEKKQNSETQLQESKLAEMEEVVAKEIKANKKIPNTELGKINSRVFQNICLAVIIMSYLNFVILGFVNIEESVFITDLKVFSVAILIVSIGIFEYAYKKDSGRHAIHGIEILILSFITMILIYVDLMWTNKFIYIVAFVTYAFAIYYVAKSIIIYKKMKKEYFLSEMKEIIKK